MAEWQDDLPPLVREKLARIGDASPEEKARMKELGNLDSLLADFFGDAVDAEGLYERLKQYQDEGKQFLLQEAQARLKGSFKEKESRIAFEDVGAGTLTVRLLGEGEEPEAAAGEEQDGAVLELNAGNFDEALRKHRVLVVDCWAEWCAPCRMVAPIIEDLAREYHGTIAFGKLDVDRNPSVAARYHVMSIPTLLVFKDWQLVDQMVGAQPKQALQQRLAAYLD